jgi:hypothetical protein
VRKRLTPLADYLAVDLHVRSRRSLAPLLQAWPNAQTPERIGSEAPRWLVVSGPVLIRLTRKVPDTADDAVRAWVRAIDRLPARARRCWNQATSRIFDVGIQAGLAPSCYEEVVLPRRTVEAIARVRGQIQITLYAPRRE